MSENKSGILVAPSLLGADFFSVHSAIQRVEQSGAQWLHLDVMDGHFVPNLTFGPKMIQDIRRNTKLVLDTHLMIEKPELSWEQYADAGSDYITFHAEAVVHGHRLATAIRQRGCKAGISLVPSTPVAAIAELLPEIDLVLVMSVNPGFGGQKLIPRTLDKLRELNELRNKMHLDFKISIDGGVNLETLPDVLAAKPDVVVAGSAFFSGGDPHKLMNRIYS